MMTGNPISSQTFLASSKLSTTPSLPGTTGTLFLIMVSLATALSPMELIDSGDGPMNLISCSRQILENSAFSERNP